MSTVPESVPNAIVDTGTLAARAASSALATVRPLLLAPSLINTIRAGAGFAPLSVLVALKLVIAPKQANTASPIAVDAISWRFEIAVLIASRSVVGATITLAAPPNDTSPRLIRGGRISAKRAAAACAALIR